MILKKIYALALTICLINVPMVCVAGDLSTAQSDASTATGVVSFASDALDYKLAMRYPQHHVIEKIQKDIEQQFFVNRFKRYGINGVAVVGAALTIYSLLNGFISREEKSDNKKVDPVAEPIYATRSEIKSLQEDFEKYKESISPKFLSLSWFKQEGSAWGSLLLRLASAQIIFSKVGEYLKKDLLHDNYGTYKWFSQKKSLVEPLAELRQYVLVLDGPASLEGKNKIMYYNRIVSAINSFVDRMESIIAFVLYKNSLIKDGQGTEVAEIGRYLFNTTHEFCSKVDALLKDEQLDVPTRKSTMESLVNDLNGGIGRLLASFARIEGEKGI